MYDESPTYVTTWLTVMPKISILILLFEIYFHMALPTYLDDYNSITVSLIDLLNPEVLSSTVQTNLPDASVSLLDSIQTYNNSSNNSNIYNNLSFQKLIEEVILLDKKNTMISFMLSDNYNIDLLTSLRGSSEIILKNILLFSSLISLIIGTVLGLSQIKIKRLLAYSTISHVGFLLLCLAIKTEVSIESLIFYLIQYSFTNLNGFLIILAFPLSLNYLINYKGIPSSFHNYFSNIIKNTINTNNPLSPSLYKDPSKFLLNPEALALEKAKEDQINKEKLENSSGFRLLADNTFMDKEVDNSYIAPLFKNTNSLKNIQLTSDSREYKADLLFIKELQDHFKFNPALSLSFAITLFSMAGIPPFIGFFGKQSVIYSAIDSGFYFMTLIAILVSVISAAYYLKLIKEAYSPKTPVSEFRNQDNNDKEFSVFSSFITFLDNILKIEKNYVDLKVLNFSNIHAFVISFLTFSIILFFLNPSILMNSASLITLNYFYL